MKVAFITGVNSNLDAFRGIGTHTKALLEGLEKIKTKDFKIVEDPKAADITHYTKFNPFFVSLPFVKPSKKVVLTIHDLIPLIYSKHYPPGIKGRINFAMNKFLIWKNVDAIITISETSKKDICRFLNIDPKKVYVIYLAPKKEYKKLTDIKSLTTVKNKFNLPSKFVFYFGDINYNKNIPTLVEACKLSGISLVIAGKQAVDIDTHHNILIGPMDYLRFLSGKTHPEIAHYEDLQEIFNKNKVLRLGYVSDEEANVVYNLASVCVQPSYYEGFGLSVIHAMAAGCPVVASKTQALVEIGQDVCLFADPNNPKDMAQKISQVVNNQSIRESLVKKGKILVKKFSWEHTAKETLDVYIKCLKK